VTASFPADDLRFRSLMLEHQSMVFSIALRILGDRSAAEEAAQDVFLELHAKLDDLRSDEHVLHWLRRVTVHRAIDRVRQRERRPEVLMDWHELPDIPDRSNTVDDDLPFGRQLQQLVAGSAKNGAGAALPGRSEPGRDQHGARHAGRHGEEPFAA
jgi:RNA polymerase sigma factor (sigma-70 family)